jgi:toxin ParE1/3/4
MKLRYSRGALADLEKIFGYIARDNPRAAARLVERIERVSSLIAAQPYMGMVTRNAKFRRFPVGNYLIVYEIGTDEIVIHYDSQESDDEQDVAHAGYSAALGTGSNRASKSRMDFSTVSATCLSLSWFTTFSPNRSFT